MPSDGVAILLKQIETVDAKLRHISAKVDEIRQLVGPFAVSFPDGSLLTQTIHGLKYFIDPDDMVIAPQIVIYRQWEADLSEVFRNLCHPGSVVIDVGANFGYFTILAANQIGGSSTGQVFSFEPNPRLAALLRRNVDINWSMSRINFYQAAVADRSGELQLHIPKGRGANASLSAPEEYECDVCTVSTFRLDDVIPDDLAVDLLKIDVEGHEVNVLRGAQKIIERSPNLHIVMEWSKRQMGQAGIDPVEVVSMLDGFTPHRIELGSAPLAFPESFDWLMSQEYVDTLLVRI